MKFGSYHLQVLLVQEKNLYTLVNSKKIIALNSTKHFDTVKDLKLIEYFRLTSKPAKFRSKNLLGAKFLLFYVLP